ncbi:MAG TPA: GlsB/YeaQ/YmgE family stress response membrane protein [Gemmatimonadaceae bacterium]|nr:GlsB/YeaQ/YmgE family stress response membrane protein [Gemmatimonadaceae bacterium]
MRARTLYRHGDKARIGGAGFIASVLGAILLLWLYRRFAARPAAP